MATEAPDKPVCVPDDRRPPRSLSRLVLASLLIVCATRVTAEELLIAVASNFYPAMEALAQRFADTTGHAVKLVPGSTGKHYAQIRNGAPFDLFFAADRARPEKLEREGIGLPQTRFTYARGELVLWSPDPDLVDPEGKVLQQGNFSRLSIANPRLAPYGEAARESLTALGLWGHLQDRLVRGENVAQAFHFVHSGNAELGLIARAQLSQGRTLGSHWVVPPTLYTPIDQQCMLLREGSAGRAFLEFVQSPEALMIIRQFGYAPRHAE